MKISKKYLRNLIRKEKRRILREQSETAATDSREHHWPSADGPMGDTALDLAEAWHEMELQAWSAGDPSMNQQGELSEAESKEWWLEQVDAATEELEAALGERLRQASIVTMQEFTDKLINGDFS